MKMRKIIVVLSAVAIVAAFSSCKKDCVCTAKKDTISYTDTYKELTKKECKDKEKYIKDQVTEDVTVSCKQ